MAASGDSSPSPRGKATRRKGGARHRGQAALAERGQAAGLEILSGAVARDPQGDRVAVGRGRGHQVADAHALAQHGSIFPRHHDLQHGIGDGVIGGRRALPGPVHQDPQGVPGALRRRALIFPALGGGIDIDMAQVEGDILHFRAGDQPQERPQSRELADQAGEGALRQPHARFPGAFLYLGVHLAGQGFNIPGRQRARPGRGGLARLAFRQERLPPMLQLGLSPGIHHRPDRLTGQVKGLTAQRLRRVHSFQYTFRFLHLPLPSAQQTGPETGFPVAVG